MPDLERATSLHDWSPRHASERIEPFVPAFSQWPNEPDDTWCATSSYDFAIESGLTGTRRIYFFVPSPPTPLQVPTEDSQSLIDQCRSGMVQTELDDPDADRAARAFKVLTQSIDASLGPGDNVPRLEWSPTSNWTGTRLWERNGTALAVGGGKYGDQKQHNRIAAVGYGPASKMQVRYSGLPYARAKRDACFASASEFADSLAEAVAVAAVGGTVEGRIRAAIDTIRQKNYCEQHPTPQEGEAISDSVLDFVEASRTLSTTRRAAGLVAADGVLSRSGVAATWTMNETPSIRQRLEAHGARFDWDELGGGYTYTHGWLTTARQVDPDGRGGELTFLTLMRMGFNTGVGCEPGGTYAFETVVEEGVRYLRRHPKSPISPEIHFLLALAYSDVVGLAEGHLGFDEDAEARKFKDRSLSARSKAIGQYRIVFEMAPLSANASSSWPTAWRLAAGLPPTQTRFFCVYD